MMTIDIPVRSLVLLALTAGLLGYGWWKLEPSDARHAAEVATPESTPIASAVVGYVNETLERSFSYKVEVVSVTYQQDPIRLGFAAVIEPLNGRLVVVTLRVTNLGQESVPFPAARFPLTERFGGRFFNEGYGALYPDADEYFTDDLIPNVPYELRVVYDVPAQAEGLTLAFIGPARDPVTIAKLP